MKLKRISWQLSPENPFHLSQQSFEKEECFEILDVHRELHLNYNVSGTAYSRVGDKFITMERGDLMLNIPWEIHGTKHVSANLQLYSLTIDTASLLKALLFCSNRLQLLFLLSVEERWKLLQNPKLKTKLSLLLSTLFNLKRQDEQLLRMEQWLLILQIFVTILAYIPFQEKLAEKVNRLAPAIELLTKKTDVSVSDAAGICHLSVSRFSYLFSKVYRISFKTYQLEQRLNRAAVNLKEGMSVKETAASEKFFDTSYFVKCFVKRFGITPGKFK